ncbi:hypothetical protein BEP19_01010 [Ammoniphilus oxalaticus]|uniref:Peroxiredoxin n=1 Tax=Ammoniphilus oxalaticus TaxID=66863 RepID=A0A419SMN7_9BACL|nr:OsmC family protein [Ammoniphilus oxalaticus]RKD25554.1 hypothetical protein BEP19_01010 [Ammoniphilus oxalaticus]
MSKKYHFNLEANWSGGRDGAGKISSGKLQAPISAPAELGGPGTGTNPEELLLGAASTCYLITLGIVLTNRKLPVEDITLASECILDGEGGLKFEKIIHRPTIILGKDATEEDIETAKKGAERAESACMISKTLEGNVEVTVEPTITIQS